MPNLIQSEYRSGNPIKYSDGTITPFSKLIQINIPKLRGGLIWNRPHSILVTDMDGDERIMHIRDVTRLIILYLSGICATFFVFGLLLMRRK